MEGSVRLRSAFALLLLVAAVGSPAHARASTGGPDSFGYTWGTGGDGPGYLYDFASGANLNLGDEEMRTVALPFTFTFYGEQYDQVNIHSNGVLSFGPDTSIDAYPSIDCPIPMRTPPTILGYWTDLAPNQGSLNRGIFTGTEGTAPDRRFVVEFYDIPYYNSGSDGFWFEFKLFESDGHVELHYRDTDGSGTANDGGSSAGIGLAWTGDRLQFSCEEASVGDMQAIGFYPPVCVDDDSDSYCDNVDCDDGDPTVHPDAAELCDGEDTDCDGDLPVDEVDGDSDGYAPCDNDCDDDDPLAYPADLDGDGWSACFGDCDDTDPDVNPADDDLDGYSPCDGDCDDDSLDLNPRDFDQDGLSSCGGDCDDINPDLNYLDADGDDHFSCEDDCDDADPLVNPRAAEACDGVDNDCDGDVDENPNCATVDDPTPYGCLVACDHGGRPSGTAAPIVGVLLFGLTVRRRRKERVA